MRDVNVVFIERRSLITLSFGFPYAGEQRATITYRIYNGKLDDFYFQIERGQIECSPGDGCGIDTRLDDGKVNSLHFNPTDIGPVVQIMTAAVTPAVKAFYAAFPHAKRLRIRAFFYRQGAQILDFDLTDFEAALESARAPPSASASAKSSGT